MCMCMGMCMCVYVYTCVYVDIYIYIGKRETGKLAQYCVARVSVEVTNKEVFQDIADS